MLQLSPEQQDANNEVQSRKNQTTHYYERIEVNLSKAESFLTSMELKTSPENQVQALFVKAISRALRDFSLVNSAFGFDTIKYYQDSNVAYMFVDNEGPSLVQKAFTQSQ